MYRREREFDPQLRRRRRIQLVSETYWFVHGVGYQSLHVADDALLLQSEYPDADDYPVHTQSILHGATQFYNVSLVADQYQKPAATIHQVTTFPI